MAKGRNKPRKHIKQAAFRDHNFSSIEAHPRKGKQLQSPYRQLPNVQFTSWRDDFLPNILWAGMVAVSVPRDDYLALFRMIVGEGRKVAHPEDLHLVHSYLTALSYEDFDRVMSPIKSSPDAYRNLSALRVLDSLPDREHWARFTSAELPEDPWQLLARAIAAIFEHQSQTATDVRWLKVIQLVVAGKLKFGPAFSEQLDEIRLYPNHGDMRSVRPSIRSMEMAVRNLENGSERLPEAAELKSEEFWQECLGKTSCIAAPTIPEDEPNRRSLLDELTNISVELAEHFDTAAPSSGIVPRKDGAFGLVFYALHLLLEAAASRSHQMAGGRIFFRSLTECFLTLHYLTSKDDPTIWEQYRNYGIGQAKLSFLKLVREEAVPEYVSLDDLHDLANEDTWMEFRDIDLGSWQSLDLRRMSEAAGCKDTYDRFYGWTSGFVHGHWTAVRDTAFTTCFNPLHRFHRIPAPTRGMPSILPDGCALINRMLDDLSALYPPFKPRLKWHKTSTTEG